MHYSIRSQEWMYNCIVSCIIVLSSIRPVPHSAEIPVPVFAQLPSLEDVGYDEKLSDSNDADFEIEQETVARDSISMS